MRSISKRRTIPCLSLLVLVAAPFLSDSLGYAQRPPSTRLSRLLLGKNENARREKVSELRKKESVRTEAIDDLITVIEVLAERAEEGDTFSLATYDLFQVVGMSDRAEARQALIKMLQSPRIEVAMAAANSLGENQVTDAIEPIKKQIDGPNYKEHYGFRFNLLRALLQMKDPQTNQFLRKLSNRLDGQLRHELIKALKEADFTEATSATAKKPDTSQDAEAPKKDLASVLANAGPSESMDRIKFGKSQYYDIPIHAKRLLFVIDCSGSMLERTRGGTRLSDAKRELTAAIEGLAEDSEFGILLFSEGVHPWRSFLTIASQPNKEAAILFVRGLTARNSTNTHGALRTSIDFDDQLETVFLLTDGRPTAGKLVLPEKILDDIMTRNQIRNLTINTIGIGVSRPTEQFLKAIAERSNGVYRRP